MYHFLAIARKWYKKSLIGKVFLIYLCYNLKQKPPESGFLGAEENRKQCYNCDSTARCGRRFIVS
jgi:hypothetical protein